MISRREFFKRALAVAACTPFIRHAVPLFQSTRSLQPGLRMIPMSSIIVDHTKSCRLYPRSINTALVESIREMGVMNPITVNAKDELVSGFARVEAARQLGFTKIMANVRPELDDTEMFALMNLVQNRSTCVSEIEDDEDDLADDDLEEDEDDLDDEDEDEDEDDEDEDGDEDEDD